MKVTLALILGRIRKLGIYGIERGKKQQMKESKVMGLICIRWATLVVKIEAQLILGLKNVASHSKSSNNASGVDNGPLSPRNLVSHPRQNFNGGFKGLKGSNMLEDSISG
ncbi:hypothetical protein ES332_A11G262500v1 [Gossypium tomentosum]|uniref:Uncharacterized protein n=1 Tax=Gossypium tomentosum TaxID=34277 RepID=A0A5D2NJA3_GOSTO|nr:hypothetical protein ES332_A11G262500v1 [Gossypium tomentosum]